ncbi:hypothetical protein B9Z55_026836 [Caenorhabditis nigoni]|uniref:F-box domain-containing protein n=1 Tax=Caenorhabditis nigoni TaxID=1611254 RepID=A0A2G5SHL8_9PELO|nr:hypothetical protein B9Z55_026836 [Caenorhabditis nigoni]
MPNELIIDDKAFRSILLYEFLVHPVHFVAFDRFSSVFIGHPWVLEDFRYWFDVFYQRKFDDDENDEQEPIRDMRDVFRIDKQCLRIVILYESLHGKLMELNEKYQIQRQKEYAESIGFPVLPVSIILDKAFDRYQNMIRVFGYDIIDFSEFSFWYYRFLGQQFDWDFEPTEFSRYSFSDLPISIAEKIVKETGYFEWCRLRKVSRGLRDTVDNLKIDISLDILIRSTGALIKFNDNDNAVDYTPKNKKNPNGYTPRRPIIILEELFVKPFIDLSILFKNSSKVNFKLFKIECQFGTTEEFENKFFGDLKELLKELNTQIHVESIALKAVRAIDFLGFMKPGVLKTIQFDRRPQISRESMEEIVEMKQWKHAKNFVEYGFFQGETFPLPMENLFHFRKIDSVWLAGIDNGQLIKIKEVLLNSSHIEAYHLLFLNADFDWDVIDREFGSIIPESDGEIRHLKIPDSQEYYQIDLKYYEMRIQRKCY